MGHQSWRVIVTTAEGGRGHDYRVVDPEVDEKGGLLLILTWVPWSEREWIQFLGRTGRQDRHGQYAVCLNAEDESVQDAMSLKEEEENLASAMLRMGDEDAAERFAEMSEEISKGKVMHQFTSRYWALQNIGKLTKDQTWHWKRMCETYAGLDEDELREEFDRVFFDRVVPPAKELDTEDRIDADIKPQRLPQSSHSGVNKWNAYFLGDSVATRKSTTHTSALPAQDQAPSQKGEVPARAQGPPGSPEASKEDSDGESTTPTSPSNRGASPQAGAGRQDTGEAPKAAAGSDTARKPEVPKLALGSLKLAES
jgi:hypothetical protein